MQRTETAHHHQQQSQQQELQHQHHQNQPTWNQRAQPSTDLAALKGMTTRELRERYAEVFGEVARSHNRVWLLRRVAWRVQMLAEGDLAERTIDRVREKAATLARDVDLRVRPPTAGSGIGERGVGRIDGLATPERTVAVAMPSGVYGGGGVGRIETVASRRRGLCWCGCSRAASTGRRSASTASSTAARCTDP